MTEQLYALQYSPCQVPATVDRVNTDLDDPRLTAIGLLAEAYTGLMNRLAAQLEEHRLSAVEFEVLMRLARSPGERLRMTNLAAQTSLSTSGVTRVVDRMDRDGLVRREPCVDDRRSFLTRVAVVGSVLTVDPLQFIFKPGSAYAALCGTCSVQGPCLAWALQVGDCHGVWGATTPRERRAMLVAWRERVGPGGETIDDDTDEEDRRLLSLTPVSR